MKVAKKTIGLKSHSLSPSVCWGKNVMCQTALMFMAPANAEMPTAKKAAEESDDTGTDSGTLTYSQEPHFNTNLNPEGKHLVIHLRKAEPKASMPVTPEWPEGKKWGDTPSPLTKSRHQCHLVRHPRTLCNQMRLRKSCGCCGSWAMRSSLRRRSNLKKPGERCRRLSSAGARGRRTGSNRKCSLGYPCGMYMGMTITIAFLVMKKYQ